MRGKKEPVKKSRPSAERRQILKANQANKFSPVSNGTPIERYYETADKLKQIFQTHFAENKLDEAYIYGMRYATFSAKSLPQHGYYNSTKSKYVLLRKKNRKDLEQVIDGLEKVAEYMDLEELEKAEMRRREEVALRKIREREAAMKKEEEDRKAQKELMDRFKALDSIFPQTPTGVGESQTNAKLPTYEQATGKSISDQLNELPIDGDLPPPIPFSVQESAPETALPVPPPPPSYDDLINQNSRFSNYEKDSIANLRPASSTSSRDLMNDPMPPPQKYNISNEQEPATLVNPLGKKKIVISIFEFFDFKHVV